MLTRARCDRFDKPVNNLYNASRATYGPSCVNALLFGG